MIKTRRATIQAEVYDVETYVCDVCGVAHTPGWEPHLAQGDRLKARRLDKGLPDGWRSVTGDPYDEEAAAHICPDHDLDELLTE